MKSVMLILVVLISSINLKAQYKHWLSYNGLVYSNYFNKEKDVNYFPFILNQPSLTYKISKQRFGIEFNFINFYGQNYHPKWERNLVQDSSILQVTSSLFSINFYYSFLDKKWIKLNFGAGYSRRWLDQIELYKWSQFHGFNGDILSENNNGINTSFNLVLPLYRGLHLNNTIRYLYFPNSKYSKQNFIWEVGIGYMFQRKRNKK